MKPQHDFCLLSQQDLASNTDYCSPWPKVVEVPLVRSVVSGLEHAGLKQDVCSVSEQGHRLSNCLEALDQCKILRQFQSILFL